MFQNDSSDLCFYSFFLFLQTQDVFLCVCADEMTSQRDVLATTENSLAAFVTSALPNSGVPESPRSQSDAHSDKVGTDTVSSSTVKAQSVPVQ